MDRVTQASKKGSHKQYAAAHGLPTKQVADGNYLSTRWNKCGGTYANGLP
jgi:hypothetical protein